ncbi:MAG: hypothetical protein QNK27_09115, partial [Desulfuromusa sp.]|nr:hypothetical protein [Desulfuromusa sp.]
VLFNKKTNMYTWGEIIMKFRILAITYLSAIFLSLIPMASADTSEAIIQATYERADIGIGAIDSALRISFLSGDGFIQQAAFTLPNGSFDLGSALIFDATGWSNLNLSNVSKRFAVFQNGSARTVVFNFNPDSFEAGGEVIIFLDMDGDRGPGTEFFVELFDGRSADGVLGGLPDPGPSSVTVIIEPRINVQIDIKPGSYPNSINLKSKGKVPVAILTTDDFDAYGVDPDTCEFAGAYPLRWKMEDVNNDGYHDMLLNFYTQELDLTKESTEATLEGETFDGLQIVGTDSVKIVPKVKANKKKAKKKERKGKKTHN